MRVKGYVIADTIAEGLNHLGFSGRRHVYVEEIPEKTIRGEAMVHDGRFFEDDEVTGIVNIELSARLVGNKVEYSIMEVEE